MRRADISHEKEQPCDIWHAVNVFGMARMHSRQQRGGRLYRRFDQIGQRTNAAMATDSGICNELVDTGGGSGEQRTAVKEHVACGLWDCMGGSGANRRRTSGERG